MMIVRCVQKKKEKEREREREREREKREREEKRARVCFLQYCRFRICKYVYYGAGTVIKGFLTRTLGLKNVKLRLVLQRYGIPARSSLLRVTSTTICLWIMQDTHSYSSFRENVSFRAFLKRNVCIPREVIYSVQRGNLWVTSSLNHLRSTSFCAACKVDSDDGEWHPSIMSSIVLSSSKSRIGISLGFSFAERIVSREGRGAILHLFSPEGKFMITILLYDKNVLLPRMHLVSEESCQGHNWNITPCVDEWLSLGLIFEAH